MNTKKLEGAPGNLELVAGGFTEGVGRQSLQGDPGQIVEVGTVYCDLHLADAVFFFQVRILCKWHYLYDSHWLPRFLPPVLLHPITFWIVLADVVRTSRVTDKSGRVNAPALCVL